MLTPQEQIFGPAWVPPANPPVLPPRPTSIPGPIQPLNTVSSPVPFVPPDPVTATGTDLMGGVANCPAPGIASTFSGAGTGVASQQGTHPNLGAQALNLDFADVQQTIQEGRASGFAPVFKL